MTEFTKSPLVSPTRRELFTAACLIALAVLFCFRELVQHPTHILVGAHRGGENDLTAYFLRALDLPGQAIAEGRFPGWNPHLSLGSPTWGNPQSLLFYPPNWIGWWLGSSAASWLMVAHHWWTGIGAYLWARQLGARHASALIAGVIGAAAPYAIAHTAEGHYPQTCVMAWLPWTFWAFERFLATSGRRWLGVSVCLAMSFLGGHVQESFYLVMLLSGTLGCSVLAHHWTSSNSKPQMSNSTRLTPESSSATAATAADRAVAGLQTEPQSARPNSGSNAEGRRAQSQRMLGFWMLAGVVTVGMVLVELLPTFSNSQLSVRASGLPLRLSGDGLKWNHISLLWNSSGLNTESQATEFGGWEFCFHFGIVPSLLVLLGVLIARQRPGTRRLLWLLAVTVLFAFGSRSPLFRLCHAWLPGIASFRSPARALYLSSMIVAALAAIGWDTLWSRLTEQRPARSRMLHWASFVILAVIAGELATFSARVFATIPPTALRRDSSLSQFFRQQHRVDPARSVESSRSVEDSRRADRVLSGMGLYDDREAHRDGVQKLLGYEPFMFLRYALFLDALTPDGSKLDPGGFQHPSFRDMHKPLVDLAGVRYAIMPAEQREIAGWKRIATGSVPAEITRQQSDSAHQSESTHSPNKPWGYAIFENQSVLPRAFVIGSVTESGNATQGSKLPRLLEQINPRETLLLQRDVWPSDSERTAFAAATIESYADHEVRIRATSKGDGYLVLTDLFHPGWSATVDDQPTTILPADIAFRAVPLSPGEHSIVFRFSVPGWKAGAIVSAISWLAACLIAWSSRNVFKKSGSSQ